MKEGNSKIAIAALVISIIALALTIVNLFI